MRPGLAVAGLVAGGTVASFLLPHPIDTVMVLGMTTFVVVAVAALLVRWAGGTAHPAGWRWYATAVAAGALGTIVASATTSSGPGPLGSVVGQLLVVVAVAHMLNRTSLDSARAVMTTRLALFVVADLLTVHTIYRLVVADRDNVSGSAAVTLFTLLIAIAMGTGLTLVLMSTGTPQQRRVAGTLLAAQLCGTLAAALSALSTGSDLLQHLAGGVVVFGVCLLPIACQLDGAGQTPPRAASTADSAFSAMLPHAIAMLGAALLLISILVTGRLTLFSAVLGGAVLVSLLAHQAVAWRIQQQLTSALLRSQAYFRTLARGSTDPIVILDEDLRVDWVSPAITELLGLDPALTVGLPIRDVVHPDDGGGLLRSLAGSDSATGPDGKTRTARLRHADGRYRLIQARIRDLRDDPDVGALVLYCRDVTPTVTAPVAGPDLSTFATVDAGTGLPNRSALTLRIGAQLRHPSFRSGALVVLGVDGIPDSEDGEVLRELTARITRVLRGEDWLARASAGEFAVLVAGTIADAEVVAARLVAAVEPVPTTRGVVRLTASAGVALLTPDVDPGEVLRHGDLALRSARSAGPGRVRRHSDALRITQDRQDALRLDLTGALAQDQLHLVYQPVVDLALHRTVSVEALLRWQHPTFGAISPVEFVPLAEESALITELGRWVLAEATATVAALPHPDLGVAVNVSARHVRSGELVADVLAALESSGLPATRLILEITESVLLDDDHVTTDLAALRRLGVRIAVDDFGTGWSSLAYLVGLPIDVLKMDRQFLADVETDPQRRALCSSVLHLGTSLGLSVVVEGVETRAELQLLRDMGHRFIQGYLLARPTEAATLARGLPDDREAVEEPAADLLAAPVGARFPRVRS